MEGLESLSECVKNVHKHQKGDKEMKVVAITGEREVEVREVKKPVLGKNQVMMKVKGCALCTWEQRMYSGVIKYITPPFVGGHEVAGEIAEIGENVDPKAYPIGKKIVANLIKKPCGKCYFCRHGMENLCKMADDIDDGYEIPGTAGLGEYIKLNLDQVYFMPDDMPTEKAVFAEPLGCVIQSVNQTTINLGDNVVVIGGGIMGQLHVMCAKARGAYVIMSEIDPERRKLAEELGCDLTFNPMEEDAVQFVKDHTDGMGAEAVFNTTAVAAVAEQAIKMTAPGGTVVMYSSVHAGKEVPLDVGYVHSKGVKITGTKSPSVRSFTESVNCLRKGIIDPSRLVSGVFTPEQCKEAFETALRPDTFRCIIEYK